MHLKVFDRLGSKHQKDVPGEKDTHATKIAEMEAKVNGKTKNLKKATEKLNELRTDAGLPVPDDIPIRPHGPAAELTLEPEDISDSSGIKLDEVIGDGPVKPGGEIKVAEVTLGKDTPIKVVPVAAASALPIEGNKGEKKEEKKEDKPDDSDSLNKLFSQDEEEENPLASLINAMPDVTVRELMDDLAEIQRIIKEWRPISKSMR
jgi:hypothetical protein